MQSLRRLAAASAMRGPVTAAAAPVVPRAALSGAVSKKEPVRVAVTGAAGNIGYAILFRIASGAMLGADQPVILHLVEVPQAEKALEGVKMEIDDCAFPLVQDIVATSDLNKGFDSVDYALLIGAKPRGPGMERNDLLRDNANIFAQQGKILNSCANRDTIRVTVVGNPANTNALIASANAPDIPASRFSAMTRLDQNRALAQVALKTGTTVNDLDKVIIWGNHSATQYPDLSHATIKGQPAKQVIGDDKWVTDDFIPTVQKRGAAIIAARGASSAASAASACIDHTRDWALGTDKWVSVAVPSDGSYGIDEGVFYSYPVTYKNGQYNIVQGLSVDSFSQELMEKTHKELLEERDAVASLM